MDNTEKKMTKYDRKIEARKQQAEKERKEKLRGRLIAGGVVVLILAAVLYTNLSSVFAKRAAIKDTYIKVGNHEITKLEYDYFYYDTVNAWLTQFSSVLPYMGLDTSVDFADQQHPYEENMTWKDYFDRMTVEQIQMVKAAKDEIANTGWESDISEDYEEFLASMEDGAGEMDVSVADYYKARFGNYATQENVRPFKEDSLMLSAYIRYLEEENTPSEEDVKTYYEEHKDEYDQVDYYEAVFAAETEEEASDEDIAAAMKEQKKRAEEMQSKLKGGADFEELCAEYFPEAADAESEEDEEGEDTDTDDASDEESEEPKDAHLKDDITLSSVATSIQEWLTASRKAGDITVIEDTDSNCYYVLKFVERAHNDSAEETISNNMINDAITERMDELTAGYTVTDVKGDLVYLTLPESSDEENEDENAGGDDTDGDGSDADSDTNDDGDGSDADGDTNTDGE